jgi:hypothetical protein
MHEVHPLHPDPDRRAAAATHVRGAGSSPPPPDAPFRRWLDALAMSPAVICVEHGEPISTEGFEALVGRLRTNWPP